MSQAPPNNAPAPQQPQRSALEVYNPKSPALEALRDPKVIEQIEACLVDSPLTYERLMIDLGAVLTANPKLHTSVTPHGLYNCLMTAARYGTTFGDGGMWVIPDKVDNVRTLRAQESKKFIVQRAIETTEVERFEAALVFEADKPIEVTRESGRITSFMLNDKNVIDPRDVKTLIGGFGIAVYEDGRPDKIMWFDINDLNRRKNHSYAAKKDMAPAWRDDPLAMHAGAIKAAVARELAPIRTKVPGMTGTMALPSYGDTIDGEYREVDEDQLPPQSAALALSDRKDPNEQMDDSGEQQQSEQEADGGGPRKAPPYPEMPEDLSFALDEFKALQAAEKRSKGAWSRLGTNPLALKEAWEKDRQEWAKNAEGQTEIQSLTTLKNHLFAKAAEAGFPQEANLNDE